MTEQADSVKCPSCGFALDAEPPGKGEVGGERVRCPSCDWRGWLWGFHPAPPTLDRPEAALPEDAVCAHHPGKRAETICAGTGDYICSLCAVTVNGRSYSAAYLNRPDAKQQLAGAWDQTLARPDRWIMWLLLLCIFPSCQAAAAPAFLVWAGFEYVRMIRMRRDHPLYRRLVGPGPVIAAPILMAIVLGIWLMVVVGASAGFFMQWEGP